ncbi:hypothetical protein [Cupriavidus oxalaticus]|uniref:Uncharacterized protein n=1 Tax=Cupriavidus oxalaticus TaxID=96344 RepID=A0A4P7LNN2_9BURK|nr:hypothetical protein [Cupriavidus oxalaticus]QBY56469.1 hypothetical protein E0W60_36425 [Cupriavidus oxalaticus]
MAKTATCIVIACAPLMAWAQPQNPEAIRAQACAASNKHPNDRAAIADKRLYQGITVNAAICVAGAPASTQLSNDGQSVDALQYADGRMIRFISNQLDMVTMGLAPATITPLSTAPEGVCDKYVGTTVAPLSFDRALAGLPKIAPKDEFESTGEYEARAASATPDRTLIVMKPLELKIRYNADQQRFEIQGGDFGSPRGGRIILLDSDRTVGSYIGSNAFGASARVERIQRIRRSLTHKIDSSDRIFPGIGMFDIVGSYPASPVEARRLQAQLKLAYALNPKPPFQERYSYRDSKPTIDDPEEVRVNEVTLVSDVQCGLLMDGGNKVLAAYATKKPQ